MGKRRKPIPVPLGASRDFDIFACFPLIGSQKLDPPRHRPHGTVTPPADGTAVSCLPRAIPSSPVCLGWWGGCSGLAASPTSSSRRCRISSEWWGRTEPPFPQKDALGWCIHAFLELWSSLPWYSSPCWSSTGSLSWRSTRMEPCTFCNPSSPSRSEYTLHPGGSSLASGSFPRRVSWQCWRWWWMLLWFGVRCAMYRAPTMSATLGAFPFSLRSWFLAIDQTRSLWGMVSYNTLHKGNNYPPVFYTG